MIAMSYDEGTKTDFLRLFCSFFSSSLAEQLISNLSSNSSTLVEFEWMHAAKLGPQGANAVVEPLNWRNTHLRVLKLSNQQLGDLGVAYVAKSMKSNRTIEVLDLSGNSLTSKGVECLVDALLWSQPSKTTLRQLDMSHNLIDFAGCGHIARLITNADSITSLLLNNNLLNDVGLTTIANALALNCSLLRLDLQQNPASTNVSVGPIFATVLEQSNYTLHKLDLVGARVSDTEVASIQTHLDRNLSLLEERLASKEHASPKENAFKRMEVGPDSARLHIFSSDVLSPSAILRLVVTPLGANITSLIMTDCGLTKLPPQLCLMGTSLEILDLRRNRLTALPLEIRGFFKLKRLLLAHNLLQHLPPQLTSLMSLDSISLHGNPLQWIPQDVLSHAEIEDFPPADTRLFRFLAQSSAATDEEDHSLYGKLMILGQVHSGKSSLSQILDSSFGSEVSSESKVSPPSSSSSSSAASATAPSPSNQPPMPSSSSSSTSSLSNSNSAWSQQMPRYISTEGVCARTINIFGSKFAFDASNAPITPESIAITKKVSFSVIEAGGSHIYSAAHSIFFSPDLLYLVTVDLTKLSPDHSRDTIADLKNTIQTIQTMVGTQFGGAPYIALVGTFEDALSPSALTESLSLLKSHFEPHVLEIFSISNKSSRGLSILRDRVLFWAYKSKLLASPRLGCISTILRVLRSYSASRPFISRAELEQIVRVYGVEQKADRLGYLSSNPTSPRPSTDGVLANNISSPSYAPVSTSLKRFNFTFPEITSPRSNPGGDTTSTSNTASTTLTSEMMKVEEAVQILESIGAVKSFFNDPQLHCYAFIDIQFIANVFSDIMASADADGYIYRSHVPPLLWMDCRKHASMKSLFDWCRLFGLALDCGDTHYIIPSLLNALPQVAVYNAAWPAMENIDGVSSRPHMLNFLPNGVNNGSNTSITSATASAVSMSSSPPPSTISPYMTNNHYQHSSPNTIQAVTMTPGSLRLTPAIEKTSRTYHREMSQVACTEWPMLNRGITTEFVPALIFSHILIATFSLPGIQRCAWWRNGFIVRRDTSFVKVTRETSSTVGPNQCKILVCARNDSTFVFSKALLEEVCGVMDQVLKRWYPQLEYAWAIPWTHPWLAEDESSPLPLESVRSALDKGPIREATSIGNLTIREELLMPELVDHSKFYTLIPSLSAANLQPAPPRPDIASYDTTNTLPSSTTKLFKASDGSMVRFRPVADSALTNVALNLSVLRNERITSLHSVISQPPGIAVIVPKSGTLNEVLERTYNDAPLPWTARFRIAIDVVLALRYIHSQVPVVALQGLDTRSVMLNENYADPNAPGPIARIDLSAMNEQFWLNSVFAPRPFIPSVQQISQTTQTTIKLSPHSSDIYSLGVLLLQLWRNEPLEEFCNRIRERFLPPVPFYSPESLGFLAYEQLIASCVCDDPTMRPQVEQIITKLIAIASHLELASSLKLLAANEPVRRWRKIKNLQVGASTDISFSISTICKSSSNTITKPGMAAAPLLLASSSSSSSPPSSSSFSSSSSLDETIVWAGGLDGVLYGLPFPMPNTIGNSSSQSSSSSSQHQSQSSHQSLFAANLSSSSGSVIQSLHWNTISTSVLDNASVQYRMTTFGPETRDTKRRIISTETTHRHIWCLLNAVTASVLDPSRLTIVSQVEIGPCLSMSSFEDTVYTGGTNGIVSAFDGTTCKRLRQREVSKLPITAIVANNRFVWVAVSDDSGANALLICLDAQTLQEEIRYQHPMEETLTSLCLTSPSTSPSVDVLWTGGYSGEVHTFKTQRLFGDSDTVTIEPLNRSQSTHKTRILNFLWNGDCVYSCSSDSVAAWKPDSSSIDSHLIVPTADIASFTVLEKSAVITGHRNGSITIWASL
jgi:hypothetical protein